MNPYNITEPLKWSAAKRNEVADTIIALAKQFKGLPLKQFSPDMIYDIVIARNFLLAAEKSLPITPEPPNVVEVPSTPTPE